MKFKHLIFALFAIAMVSLCSASCANASNSDQTIIKSEKSKSMSDAPDIPMVFDFSASWCGPCRVFAPTFHKIEKDFEGKVDFRTIDIDQNPELAEKYGIMAVPTVIIFNAKGEETRRFVGVPEEAELLGEINKTLK